ncbi:MAG: 4-alpha-glucanotransferase [Geodermatophilaceae bacterium]|nr:4-alpha-glucanotransferase [Geodermatophilaceae bacterium]
MTWRPGTDERGVDRSYLDGSDRVQTFAPSVVERLRELVGEAPADLEHTAPLVLRAGVQTQLGPGDVACEDGTTLAVDAALPTDLPLGYHEWRPADGPVRALIVSPGRCHLPAGLREWGWAVQLYAARSRDSWGIGDLADLRRLREWAQGAGAGLLMVNPLHAAAPTFPQESSPYSPTSRRFASPLYLRPELLPGFAAAGLDVPRGMNEHREIDRDAVWRAKRPALRAVFDVGGGGSEFASWRTAAGPALQDFAVWSVLAERYGPAWRQWPAQYRRPTDPAVREYATAAEAEVGFHAWLQWALAQQLSAAAAGFTVIQDLPIGFDPDGADAWCWQDLLAEGVSVGAPPDALNTQGQDWSLPPFVPWKLRAAAYRPFVESIRASIAGAGGLRIDHMMGLFRLWWIPSGGGPTEGGYVRYPAADLLDIVALESVRAEALVIGEDLGVVESGVRAEMSRRGMLSYRLLWFAEDEPVDWPELSMGAVTTHDLPTVSGLWTGADRVEQQRYDVDPGAAAVEEMRARIGRLPTGAGPDAAVAAAYGRLGQAPSALRVATLEDAVGEQQRPNLPGVASRPNWSLALPVPIDDLPGAPGVATIAAALER